MEKNNPVNRIESLGQALAHHQAGRTAEAEKLYRELLAENQNDADANHYLGLIAHQFGHYEAAIQLISTAISARPGYAEALVNLANSLKSLGRTDEAIQNLRTALSVNPKLAEGHANLGVLLRNSGAIPEAVECYQKAIDLKPDYLAAHFNLANILKAEDHYEQAKESYLAALKLEPGFIDGHINLGSVYEALGQDELARACYQAALAHKGDSSEAWYNLAALDRAAADTGSALENARKAIQFNPGFAEAYRLLGMLHRDRKELSEARRVLEKTIELDEKNYNSYNTLGLVFNDLEEQKKALDCFEKALAINPEFAEGHNNLANVYKYFDQMSEATVHYQKALSLKPDFADAHNNYGTFLKDLGRLDEARNCYLKATTLDPNFADAHNNLGHTQLLGGDFEQGWQNYRWRWKLDDVAQHVRNYQAPLWDGSPFRNQTLFVHPEQGLGDFIQFIRYLPLVAERGGNVILETPAALACLCQQVSGVDRLIQTGQPPGAFDYHIPLLDLPLIMETNLDSVPPIMPLAPVRDEIVANWQSRFEQSTGLRVGLVWAGNPDHKNDHRRSLDPGLLKGLVSVEGVTFFSLQVGSSGAVVKPPFDQQFIDLAPHLTSFEETAAAMQQLDLVISVDSSPAHLAGTLGLPVWTLLPFMPDWRWMMERSDSPWYPSMRLFRQPEPGNWGPVIDELQSALRQLARQSRQD